MLFVEGRGDKTALPKLARRVITHLGANDALFVDAEPFTAKGIGSLVKDGCSNWHRWLSAAGTTRKNIGAVLLVLDGDAEKVPQSWEQYVKQHKSADFCAYRVAAMLAHEARNARAGDAFSLAVVFAMKEFEAWLIGGVESLRGKGLAENRGSVPLSAVVPDIDVETKRDAKGLLRELIPGYDQTLDQAVLADHVDLAMVGQRCRSFLRFQSAINKLAEAVRAGKAIISPAIQ